MLLTQTLKIQIYPTDIDIIKLKTLQKQYVLASQYTSDWIFDHDFELSQRVVHDNLYYRLRELFELPAQVAQSVMRSVIARYKTVRTQMRNKQYRFKDVHTNTWYSVSKDLNWLVKPLQFKSPVATLVKDRTYSFLKDNILSLSTLEGRIKVPYCSLDNQYFSKFDTSWERGELSIHEIDDKWYVHISVSKEFEDVSQYKHVVGIDRGLRQLLTTYDEKDKTMFVNGQEILNKRRHFKKLRQELQSKGTKSAKRKLKSIGQRENRWMTTVNHQLSKALIDKYGSNTLFVLEDLTNVTFDTVNQRKKENRYEHHSWAFYQFEQFLKYKAINAGASVLTVSAAYTSQRCPKCGTVCKEHRNRNTHEYHCLVCSYQSNDDRIAAMNIQELGRWYISGIENPKFEKHIIKLEY